MRFRLILVSYSHSRFRVVWRGAWLLSAVSCSGNAFAPFAQRDSTIVTVEFFEPLAPRETAAAYAIGDNSVMWGVSYDPSTLYQRATRWRPGQPPEDIGGPGDPANGPSTNARGANGSGVVVGFTNTDPYDWLPVRWSTAGSVDTLPSLTAPPYNGGYAYAVTDSGYVAGCSWVLTGNPENLNAVLWSPDGTPQNLGTMGGDWSCAYGLSAAGFVVGEAGAGDHAFVWSARAGMRDLGTLGGPNSRAWGVNQQGEVVGEADQLAQGIPGAFIWTAAGGMRQPDSGLAGTYSAAYAINDAGDVVGYTTSSYSGTEHAMLWRANGSVVDLSKLSFTQGVPRLYGHALAISPSGLIAGFEYNPATDRVEAALWLVTTQSVRAPKP